MKHSAAVAVLAACTTLTCALPSTGWAQAPTAPDVSTPASWAQPQDDNQSLGRVVAGAFDDLFRLPNWENAAILSIGGAGAAIGRAWDSEATARMSASRDMGTLFQHGQSIGSTEVNVAAAFATWALGRATNHPRATAIGADLIQAQIVAQLTTQGVKMAVGRTRPDGTSFSFPSGHSATAFATATVLQRNLGWKVGIPAYGVAAYVAASRVQVKRHYLSDIAFGAAVGIVAGRSVTVGKGDARFAIAPSAAPGGAGVNFTWVGK